MKLSETAFNVVNLASKFQEFFHGASGDVTFDYIDTDGVQKSTTVPNVAKTTTDLRKNGVTNNELNSMLDDYYNKSSISSLLTNYFTTSVISKAQFKANADIRKENYIASGVENYGAYRYNLVSRDLWVNRSTHWPYTDTLCLGYPISTDMRFSSESSKVKPSYILNGNRIKINQVNWADYRETTGAIFKFSPVARNNIVPIIKDSSNLPAMKQGDMAILADVGRDFLPYGSFEENPLDKLFIEPGANLTYDSDNNRLKYSIKDKTINRAIYFQYHLEYLSANATYKIKIDMSTHNYNSTDKRLTLRDPECDITITLHLQDGVSEFYYTPTKLESKLYILCDDMSDDSDDEEYIYINSINAELVSEIPVFASREIENGLDLLGNGYRLVGETSASRQDLVILEGWNEDSSRTDFMYRFGNTQFTGSNNASGLTGLTEGSFPGYESYSKFNNWQEDGELVGKGYKWSELTELEKLKFSSDPDNNVFRDGNKWIQFRYRFRIINGLGSSWDNFGDLDTDQDIAYNNNYTSVKPKGHQTDIPCDLGTEHAWRRHTIPGQKSGWFNTLGQGFTEDIAIGTWNENHNGDKTSYDEGTYALPIVLVQRRNSGIYHKIFNPAGSALSAYDDGNGLVLKWWWDLPNDFITSISDCFNPDKIACYKPSNGSVSTLTDMDETYFITGTIASGKSGREDNLYYDTIDAKDVKDLRLNAQRYTADDLITKYSKKALAGEIRGEDNQFELMAKYTINTLNTGNGYGRFVYTDTESLNILYDKYNIINIYQLDWFKALLTEGSFGEKAKAIISHPDVGIEVLNTIYCGNYYFGCDMAEDNSKIDKFKNKENVEVTLFTNQFTSHKYNDIIAHTDIIGDSRKIQDRVKLVVSDDATVDLIKNEYIRCDNADNNSGTVGHFYRLLTDNIAGIHTNSTDGDANAADGHIDFSDDAVWIDLGDTGTAGGYPDEWAVQGITGSPLIIDEQDNRMLPIDYTENVGGWTYTRNVYFNRRYIGFKLSKKYQKVLNVLVSKKDGSWYKYNAGNANDEYCTETGGHQLAETWHNVLIFNIDKSYSDLGYDSIDEMLDRMIVIVTYTANTNFLNLSNDTQVLALNDRLRISGDAKGNDKSDDVVSAGLIDKVITTVADNDIGLVLTNIGISRGYINNNYGIPTHAPLSESTVGNFSIIFRYAKKSPTVKYFNYLTSTATGIAEMRYVFKEIIYDEATNTFGDDGKLQITDLIHTTLDTNGNRVRYGQKGFKIPYFID